MQYWIDLWIDLPAPVRIAVVGGIVKYFADGVRVWARRIDGRWVHLLAAVLTLALTVTQSVLQTGYLSEWGPLFVDTFLSLLTALGINELTRGKGRLGDADKEDSRNAAPEKPLSG